MSRTPPNAYGARIDIRPVRVLLADRAGAGRRALAAVLRDVDGVTIAGEVGDHVELAAALRSIRADVLIIDDRLLHESNGMLLGLHEAGLRMLVIGVDDEPAFAARARRLGAEAWIAKDRADEELPPLLEAS